MTVALNHTIVHARDQQGSAELLSELLALDPPTRWGPFVVVKVGDVSLDFDLDPGEIQAQHYAFQVDEDDFDAILGRIQARGITFWADPMRTQSGQFNTHNGGRGLYWQDPDGHLLEILTRP